MLKRLTKLNNEKESFRTLMIIPTGGGKTLTAVWWLLKNAIDNNKKKYFGLLIGTCYLSKRLMLLK